MKKLALIILSSFLLGGCTLTDKFNKKPAGLEIASVPPATVFLNDENVGTTPYKNQNVALGSYTIRLVPESPDGVVLAPWETRLDMTSKVTTVISQSFAESESGSAGSILQLVKVPGNKTYLSVISDPDTISLNLDSQPHGFTPVTKLEITPGSHTLELSSPGYKPETMSVNTTQGYNLIVNIKLAADELTLTPVSVATDSASLREESASPSASPIGSAKPSPAGAAIGKPYVVINETETGWLRVRKDPSATGAELGKANVGEKLRYLGETTETGWHQVEFEGSTGWVSGKYVDLVK